MRRAMFVLSGISQAIAYGVSMAFALIGVLTMLSWVQR